MEAGLSPSYVLDEMQFYEIKPLITKAYLKDKESWEQTRLLGYILAQSNSKKKLKPTDILKFPWDEEKKGDTSISNEDVERLKAKANNYINKIQNGK